MNAPGLLCTVGLTGGLASGKSTVAVLLGRRGAALLDADAVVHDLYRAAQPGARAVAELFGPAVMAADGGVDRAALATRVLADADARRRLEAAVHPLVRERVAGWRRELAARREPPPVAVVEAALLVETGQWRAYHGLVVVWCRPEQQVDRALARGVPEDRARALLAAQTSLEDKCAVADVVIDNSGGPADLPARVDVAWQEVLALCASTRRPHGVS